MQIDGLEVLEVDVSEGVSLGHEHLRQALVEVVILLLAIDHLGRQIGTLVDPVTADGNWHDQDGLATGLERVVNIEQPANRHITVVLPVQFAGSEALSVLEQRRHLVARDHFVQQGAVDVVTLHGLALLPAAQNVARIFQDSVEEANTGSVLEVAEAKSVWNPLSLIHIQHDEEVQECLVERHEDYFVASLDHCLDHLDSAHVDMKPLN